MFIVITVIILLLGSIYMLSYFSLTNVCEEDIFISPLK